MPMVFLPEIEMPFICSNDTKACIDRIYAILEKFFPDSFSLDELIQKIPILEQDEWETKENKKSLSLFFLCQYQPHVNRFFQEIVSNWLIPGKQIDIAFYFFTRFHFAHFKEIDFAISEIVLHFKSEEYAMIAKKNLPFIEKEIFIGIHNFHQAKQILEMKGGTIDEKTSLVQERIANLVRKFPSSFDYDIFIQMQQFFVSSPEVFKIPRTVFDVSRIICMIYLIRKKLEKQLIIFPDKRNIIVKLRRSYLQFPLGIKEALCIFIGMSFYHEHEVFDQRHLLSTLSLYFPEIEIAADGYFLQKNHENKTQIIYCEIAKKNDEGFSFGEIEVLKEEIQEEIANRIEQLVSPVFMPRNEEEVMRNILTLGYELKYLKDIPQMMISFDEQTEKELIFTVILLRILHPKTLPLREIFEKNGQDLKISFDRIKIIGFIRKKYPKQANVFLLRLPSEQFLRDDYSVDLYAARLKAVALIQNAIGEVRDFNGGMIVKQYENFLRLQQHLGELGKRHFFLLQNFFHGIKPIEFSSTFDPVWLKNFFLMILKIQEENDTGGIVSLFEQKNDMVFAIFKFQDLSVKEKILHEIDLIQFSPRSLGIVELELSDGIYLGFMSLPEEKEKQTEFIKKLKKYTSSPLEI